MEPPGPAYQQFDGVAVRDAVMKHVNSRSAAEAVTVELLAKGLIVARDFELVDERHLYGHLQSLRYAARANLAIRWVMCRETHDDLASRYRDRQHITPPEIYAFQSGEDLTTDQLTTVVDFVFVSARRWDDQSKLFGIPIRIDPGARSVMVEFITDRAPKP